MIEFQPNGLNYRHSFNTCFGNEHHVLTNLEAHIIVPHLISSIAGTWGYKQDGPCKHSVMGQDWASIGLVLLAFVMGIQRLLVESHHKWPATLDRCCPVLAHYEKFTWVTLASSTYSWNPFHWELFSNNTNRMEISYCSIRNGNKMVAMKRWICCLRKKVCVVLCVYYCDYQISS